MSQGNDSAKTLVETLRRLGDMNGAGCAVTHQAADEIGRLERKVAAYESMESLMAGVERAFSGAPLGNADVLAAAKSIVRTADETDGRCGRCGGSGKEPE